MVEKAGILDPLAEKPLLSHSGNGRKTLESLNPRTPSHPAGGMVVDFLAIADTSYGNLRNVRLVAQKYRDQLQHFVEAG